MADKGVNEACENGESDFSSKIASDHNPSENCADTSKEDHSKYQDSIPAMRKIVKDDRNSSKSSHDNIAFEIETQDTSDAAMKLGSDYSAGIEVTAAEVSYSEALEIKRGQSEKSEEGGKGGKKSSILSDYSYQVRNFKDGDHDIFKTFVY